MSADLILYNGRLHTVDREKPQASAVAIKDGRFVVVGSDAQAMALQGPGTQIIDLHGRTVIPGLNDSEAEVTALSKWVATELGPDVPLHFTAFHPDWKLTDAPPTPSATLGNINDAPVLPALPERPAATPSAPMAPTAPTAPAAPRTPAAANGSLP